jgi:hypothetical protein
MELVHTRRDSSMRQLTGGAEIGWVDSSGFQRSNMSG